MSSFSFKRHPRRKQFMRFITKVYELLEDSYWEEHDNNGLTKTKIADSLGVHKSFVTRLLRGTSNMTLETFSDLAFELNRDIKIDLVERDATTRIIKHSYKGNVVPLPTSAVSEGWEDRVLTFPGGVKACQA